MIELPEGYYLSNFIELIDCVYVQYQDLLAPVELQFYQQFHALSETAQKLYVRMLTRKGELFRASKLVYREIPDTMLAARELADRHFIAIDPAIPHSELLSLFSKAEWLDVLARHGQDTAAIKALRSLKRVEFDQQLDTLLPDQADLTLKPDALLQLQNAQLFDTFKLLFFGNLNQDLTEFVLRDIGLYRFETYRIDRQTRLFPHRQTIDNLLNYYAQLSFLDDILGGEPENMITFHQSLPVASQHEPVLNRRVENTQLKLARSLERVNELESAMMIYQKCQRPPARERQARILVKQDQIEEALLMCQNILNTSHSDEENVFATDFGYRIAKKHQLSWPQPCKYQPPSEHVILSQTAQSVERHVADYYSQQGNCYVVENTLFNGVFGLLYWDVLFAPVQGAFSNPFQTRPHDLYEANFLDSRQHWLNRSNATLNNVQQVAKELLACWEKKCGTANVFVRWEGLTMDLVQMALSRIPSSHWQAIFSRLWRDLRANRTGFPDLIHFPNDGGYQLIEVKGPGDRLQKNQLRWMQYFEQHTIPHKVIHVEWQ